MLFSSLASLRCVQVFSGHVRHLSFHSGSEKESAGPVPELCLCCEGGTVPRTATPARGQGASRTRVRRGPAALPSVEILFLEPGLLWESKFYFHEKLQIFFFLDHSRVIAIGIKEICRVICFHTKPPNAAKIILKICFPPVICHFLLLSKMISILMSLLICGRMGKLITKYVGIISKLSVNGLKMRM